MPKHNETLSVSGFQCLQGHSYQQLSLVLAVSVEISCKLIAERFRDRSNHCCVMNSRDFSTWLAP